MDETSGTEVLKMSGPELVTNVQEKLANVVTGAEFDIKNDNVYRTHLKEFAAVQKAALEQGKKPTFWNEVKAHIHAADKQFEFTMKDFVYLTMRGGFFGSAFRFVQEHMPFTGGAMRRIHESEDLMLKPSNFEKRRVAGLTTLRTPALTLEKRITGITNWILRR